jgi:small subunit ribosomal protein S1
LAKVTNLTDYGCFVEIEEGVEGLVHVSEMDWTNKNVHPSKVVQLGDEVEVMVLDIDEERRRISLGIKQCQSNPWDTFSSSYSKGDRISGRSSPSPTSASSSASTAASTAWCTCQTSAGTKPAKTPCASYKKGDEIETVVLSIDPERERISLGIKQLEDDPFSNYVAVNDRGSIVTGEVTEVDAKAVTIKLADEVEGILKASDISRERVEDARNEFKVGDSVEAKIVSVDRKNRGVTCRSRPRTTKTSRKRSSR